MVSFNFKKIFTFAVSTLAFLGVFAIILAIPASAQLRTVDLSRDSLVSTDNFDGSEGGVANLILNIARWIIFIVGAVAVLFLIWGSILFLTSAGNEERIKSGKSTIINAVIGLVIAILSFTIVNIIQSILTSGTLSNVLGG